MRSRSGAALLVMALAFLFLGLLTLRWELVSLLIPLALVLYLTYLLNRPPIMDLRFTRTLDAERVQEEEKVEVRLLIENQGESLDYFEVIDGVPPGTVVVEGRERFPLSLGEGESMEIRYTLGFLHRGVYEFGDLLARWSDPTLMVNREQRLRYDSSVLVLPKVQDLKRCGLRPSRLSVQSGNIPSTSLGPGLEFFCLREYVSGDELRHINWKATARRDRLQVNDFESERSGDVVLVVDARSGIYDREVRQRMVDKEVDAATSLASYFLKDRNRVGLLVLGDTMEIVPLAYGKRQFYRVVDRLMATNPGGLRSTRSIGMAMGRYFPTSSLVVAISPLEDRRIINSLMELGGRGHEVVVLSLDTFSLEVGKMPSPAVAEVAETMHRVRRRDVLAELGRHCQVLDWDPRVPLFKYFMEGRASASHRR